MTDDLIAGERVVLRVPRLDDAENLFTVVTSDPAVTRYLSWPPHRGVEETRVVISGLFNVGVDHTWLITLRDGGESSNAPASPRRRGGPSSSPTSPPNPRTPCSTEWRCGRPNPP